MTKYRYTVVSDEYVGALRRLRKTGRKIKRPAQVLFNPQLRLFGVSEAEANHIRRMPVGMPYVDHHGDIWERIA